MLTCQVEVCECVARGGAHCAEEVESTICDGTMRELQACEQRHVSDDQPERGFSHLQTAQPQALHVLHLGTVITAYRHTDDIYVTHPYLCLRSCLHDMFLTEK